MLANEGAAGGGGRVWPLSRVAVGRRERRAAKYRGSRDARRVGGRAAGREGGREGERRERWERAGVRSGSGEEQNLRLVPADDPQVESR